MIHINKLIFTSTDNYQQNKKNQNDQETFIIKNSRKATHSETLPLSFYLTRYTYVLPLLCGWAFAPYLRKMGICPIKHH